MKKYVCSVCGYVYDEAAGIPEKSISPNTEWGALPEDFTCPLCGANKSEFTMPLASETSDVKGNTYEIQEEKIWELSFGELSTLCSNLSKGCEKQYRPQEAELFGKLSRYYSSKSDPTEQNQFDDLSALIRQDLGTGYAQANIIAAEQADRGALRALVWGEKVTKILSSLLSRYEKQKGALLENTNIFVCEICGFVYIGNGAPEICPVCKVPNMKIKQIQRGAI